MLILDSKPNGLSEPALVPEYASTETPARNNTQRAQVEQVLLRDGIWLAVLVR